jgi:hypothetical protein
MFHFGNSRRFSSPVSPHCNTFSPCTAAKWSVTCVGVFVISCLIQGGGAMTYLLRKWQQLFEITGYFAPSTEKIKKDSSALACTGRSSVQFFDVTSF